MWWMCILRVCVCILCDKYKLSRTTTIRVWTKITKINWWRSEKRQNKYVFSSVICGLRKEKKQNLQPHIIFKRQKEKHNPPNKRCANFLFKLQIGPATIIRRKNQCDTTTKTIQSSANYVWSKYNKVQTKKKKKHLREIRLLICGKNKSSPSIKCNNKFRVVKSSSISSLSSNVQIELWK